MIIEKAIDLISKEKGILNNLNKDEIEYLHIFQLISIKPVVYVCNVDENSSVNGNAYTKSIDCLLYTSPSPRDRTRSRMPSSA